MVAEGLLVLQASSGIIDQAMSGLDLPDTAVTNGLGIDEQFLLCQMISAMK